MPITPESLRLQLIFKESGKGARKFAESIGISETSLWRMMKGEQDIMYTAIRAICLDLGYSPTWFLLGTGLKKREGEESNMITEIQMLRTEIDIMAKLNLTLRARLTELEKKFENLESKNVKETG